MKTFTTYAEKKAKQFLNLLQGYTKGIRITAILILLLMGVNNAWGVTFNGGEILVLKPNSNWTKDGARFAAYFFGNGDKWVSMTAVSINGTSGYYQVTAPSGGYKNVIFCRMNGGNQTNNWDNKWNQTGDLTYDGTKNVFTVPDGNWDGSTSGWGNIAIAVTLDAQSGTGGTASVNVNYGEDERPTVTAPTRTGYDFGGFYTSTGGGGSQVINASNAWQKNISNYVDANGRWIKNAACTLYAKWTEKTYSLTFKHDGHGTIKVGGTTVNSGSTATVNHVTTKTLVATPNTGYNFSGWTLSGNNTSAVTIGNTSASSTTIKATNTGATVTANFTPKTYAITLNANYTGGTNGSATATYNKNTVTNLTQPTRTDYRCNGYYTATSGGTLVLNTDGTLAKSVSGYTDASSNWIKDGAATLYAQWTYDVTEYTVTFGVGTGYTSYGSLGAYNNTTSASITSPAQVRSQHSVTFTATPNTGYEVEGWYTNAACTEGKHDAGSATYTTTVNDALNVYVKFVEKTWSVAFAASTGGAVSPKETQTVGEANGVTIIATTNKGYTFAGWTSSNGGSFNDAKAEKTTFYPTAATTVTASFTENLYAITVKSSDNNHGTVRQSTDKAGIVTTIAITATPKHGYQFVNWTATGGATIADPNSPETTITASATGTVTANFELIPPTTVYFRPKTEWKDNNPVIICDGNPTAVTPYDCSGNYYTAQVPATTVDLKFGGNGEQTLSLTVPTDDKVLYDMTSQTITALYLKPNSNWTQASAWFAAAFLNSDKSKTEWVRMTDIGGTTYSCAIPAGTWKYVIFCRMNPNGTDNSNNKLNWTNKWDQTGDLEIPTNGTNQFTIKDGDWNNASGSWHKVWDNSCWKTFTAPTYSITKTVGTGGTVTVSKESGITLNEQVTVTVTASNGYTYKSGTITIGTNEATNLAAGTSTHTICGNTEISVEWNANKYSVKFDANGGEGEMANQDCTYDAAAQALTANTFTRTGYTFAGWNTQADGQGTSYTDKQSVQNLTTENNGVVTLYAQWTPHTYTVKFVKNDGAATGKMQDQKFTYDKAQKLTANAFEKTNWKFAGWNTKADGSGTPYSDQQSVSNLTATDNGVVNLYAQWAPAQDAYTITIKANGNGTVSPESVIVNKSITAEVTATPNEGYKFIGWKTEGGAEVADKGSVSTANASSTTVTAVATGSVIANFEALLPNTLTLTHQPMYKERPNPLTGAGGNGTEANPYKIYSEEFVRITAAALPEVEGLTAYYKFGDTPEQESNVFDFSDISGSTPTKINVKAYYKKNDAVWGGEVSADSYYFIIIPLPYYISTVPAGEMSIDRIAAGENILVQFRSDDQTTVNLYVQKGDDNNTKTFLTQISNTASYDYTYEVPDTIDPCVLRFIAESEGLHNGRSFSKYAEVALYKNVTIKVNDPNSLLSNVYLWRGGDGSESADVKTEWPGEDFIQTFGTWRVFVVKYPYYDHFIVNDGSNENQTFDYEITGEDKCYQLSEEKEQRDEYYNYTLSDATCPPDLMVSDIEAVTIMEGEQIVVMPKILVGLGYQLSDVEVDVFNSNTFSVRAMMSGTNVTVLGTSAGTADITVTYSLGDLRIQRTFTVTVEKKNTITVQVKVPIASGGTYDNIGWSDNSLIKIHYWFTGKQGDIQLRYVYEEADKYKYMQAEVPLDANGYTSFLIGYNDINENWEKTADIKNVNKDGCYTLKNAGYGNSPTATRDGDVCWDENDFAEYQVKVLMQNGKTYLSNTTNSKESILSFFAPGKNATGRNAGVVMLYRNGKVAGLIEANVFDESTVYVAQVAENGTGLTNVAPYTGNYYIRTWGTDGDINNQGWDSPKNWDANQKAARKFTFFISRENEFYNHYWVQAMNTGGYDGKDVSACVANDYNDDLAGKLTKGKGTDDNGDIKVGTDKVINVRFGYDPRTNYFGRAIIKGSEYNDFLNIHCNNAYKDKTCSTKLPSGTSGLDNKMQDISNWVYQRDFYVPITNSYPSASLYVEATSPSTEMTVTDHLLGYVINEVTGEEDHTKPVQRTIIGSGTTNGTYLMRVVYDFKTNRLIAAWLPQGTVEVSRSETLNSDVLFVRKENEDVPQINLSGNGEKRSLESMFFAMELHRGDKDATRQVEQYWFTLPFDCKVGSISGVHGYLQIWGIQRYRGDLRAEKGWYAETPTFWEWMDIDDVMHAGEGYLLVFDKKNAPWEEIEVDKYDAEGHIMQDANGNNIKEKISMMRLYFPSTTVGFDMQQQSAEQLTRTYENHTCTLQLHNRYLQDSNWKVIGTTSYNNAGITGYTVDTDPKYEELSDAPNFRYSYEYKWENGEFKYEYTPENGKTATYKSFYGYMVQFAGTINWQPIMSETVPEGIAARRYVPANERTSFTTRLEIVNAEGEKLDQAFVALDEKATTTFDQNKDLNKVMNSHKANIYTLSENIPFAGNTLPMEKATVPVGVRIATAGEYTFRMPDGTDGISVTLVDNVTGTHTDMLMDEYTITLDAGTIENRFYLVVDPDRTATSVENIGEEAKGDEAKDQIKKFLIDGKLFIRTADGIFDAKGQRL